MKMHPDWEKEVERLEYVKQVILDVLNVKISKSAEYSKEMRAINKEMWEETGALNGQNSILKIPSFLQDINFLKRNIADSARNEKEIKMLERQLVSPYFCRIDFKEDGECAESFYIGIYGLRDINNDEILIYDWRAPISNMFYDFEPGPASYECPAGLIEGELLLKRQYRIDRGTLLWMFDTNVAIEDKILQDILAGSTDGRMKTIVSTIQREQNRAIRYGSKRVLAVQGAAGSGKTSIALHRAAYLLYRDRKTIKAENIRLYTPSGIFAEYISDVLPELGEDDIPCNTLTGLVQSTLGDLFKKYETYTEMMEWQLSQKSIDEKSDQLESMGFKASEMFAAMLEKYAEVFESKIIHFEDIAIGDAIIASRDELADLFYNSFSYMPVAKRLSRIETYVMTRINEYMKQRKKEKIDEFANSEEYMDESEIKARSRIAVKRESETAIEKVKNMISIDIVRLYQRLFKDDEIWRLCGGPSSEKIRKRTVEALDNAILLYEDQSPILYLMALLGMLDADKDAKHVMIDEAQDYSYITYKLFSRLYPNCGITLLGDASQNINPAFGIGNLKLAGELLDPDSLEYTELSKCYRSTIEIMEFASQILPTKAIPYGRHGKKPEVMTSSTVDGVCGLVTDCIGNAKKDGYSSIAIICRNLGSCQRVYRHLKTIMPVHIIENENDQIEKGVVVIPSYLAKGLEFDVAVAVILSEDEYLHEENQLFYTVCTRALHRLDICSIDGAGILKKIESKHD
ncbi:hypothetical protein CDQ83_18205 [Clostridium thermosuccinogenes]|nr:hypothetical protein CDQ83_18205 [Pseudoclostridium thermosuccinogenes]